MIPQINEEMVKIYAWVNANKLSLNIDKTNFMLFMPKSFSHCTDHIVIRERERFSLSAFLRTEDIGVHIVHISRLIITYTME